MFQSILYSFITLNIIFLISGPPRTKYDHSTPINYSTRSASYHSALHDQNQQQQQQRHYIPKAKLTYYPSARSHTGSLGNLLGSNLDFEIEIEKRPPQQPEQPTVVSLGHGSPAIVTTSKDGRVSIQNLLAKPGNTVTINSDFHASDRSLNRSSGYFSSDENRFHSGNVNYSSDEPSITSPRSKPTSNFDQLDQIVDKYTYSSNNPKSFNETINQIDALYNNLDVKTTDQQYKFPKATSTKNRRKELAKTSNEYATRYTSTGFQHIPSETQTASDLNNSINQQNRSSSTGILMDHETSNFGYGSLQNRIVYQNRLNDKSQIVHRHRQSVKQMKLKNAARKRNGLNQG